MKWYFKSLVIAQRIILYRLKRYTYMYFELHARIQNLFFLFYFYFLKEDPNSTTSGPSSARQ